MRADKRSIQDANKKLSDPNKVDPTKQDERDNDATRIRPQHAREEEEEKPEGMPGNEREGKGSTKENNDDPYKRVKNPIAGKGQETSKRPAKPEDESGLGKGL